MNDKRKHEKSSIEQHCILHMSHNKTTQRIKHAFTVSEIQSLMNNDDCPEAEKFYAAKLSSVHQ